MSINPKKKISLIKDRKDKDPSFDEASLLKMRIQDFEEDLKQLIHHPDLSENKEFLKKIQAHIVLLNASCIQK